MSVLGNVWSFLVMLVRSLLALFSWRRRAASDPFPFASLRRTADDPIARAHSRLRPILLTPRALARARTNSAASTLLPPADGPAAEPQRTSPKLGPDDAELGLPATDVSANTNTSATGSPYVSPLTPPDRCYLAPLPSVTDCPYSEPWPANLHAKPRLPGSPLKLAVDSDPSFSDPMPWNLAPTWTSTPCKNDSVSDEHKHTSALANLSHAIISRSASSIRPYDDSNSTSVSPSTNYSARSIHRAKTFVRRSKDQPIPRFHHPDAYTSGWRRRLPGRLGKFDAAARSRTSQWYDNASITSPLSVLSPPRCDFSIDCDDEDEMPLGRLKVNLARRSFGAGLGLAVHVPAPAPIVVARKSVHARHKSDGCLLAFAQGTPTRVGVGGRPSRRVLSMALDGRGDIKDWVEALSLRPPDARQSNAVAV